VILIGEVGAACSFIGDVRSNRGHVVATDRASKRSGVAFFVCERTWKSETLLA
jgi:hypothetical protein